MTDTASAWLGPGGEFVAPETPTSRDVNPAAPPEPPAPQQPTQPLPEATADDAIIRLLRDRVQELEAERDGLQQTVLGHQNVAAMRTIEAQAAVARAVVAEEQVASLRPVLEALVGVRALLESVTVEVTGCAVCGTIGGHLVECPEAPPT